MVTPALSADVPADLPASVEVRLAGSEDAAAVLEVVRAAFGARPPLDPPASALAETEESLRGRLAAYGGLLAVVDGTPAGTLVFAPKEAALGLVRFGVVPAAQGRGVATALVAAADSHARRLGGGGLEVIARVELPETVRFWTRQGFEVVRRDGVDLHLLRVAESTVATRSPQETEALAGRLAGRLRSGDLLVLTGDLGAGKTTFTRGLGRALGVRGAVTSPTFVIARVHPSLGDGPALVHVDAYRLSGLEELDDLDLDTALEDAVTVVEWGGGLAEGLAADRLEIGIHRTHGSDLSVDGDPRRITLRPSGLRWLGVLDDDVLRTPRGSAHCLPDPKPEA